MFGFESAKAVIQNLIDTGHLCYHTTPLEWLEDQSILSPWEAFCDENSLSDFADFDDLQGRWNNFREDFLYEVWDRQEVEEAAEQAVEEAFDDWTAGLDTSEKYEVLQNHG
jgi:hypothetical protein